MLPPTAVRCDKELEILHAVYLSVIILLVIIIVIIGIIHWIILRGPGIIFLFSLQTRLTKMEINKVI